MVLYPSSKIVGARYKTTFSMLRGSDQLLMKAQYDIDELGKRQAAGESALANLTSKSGIVFTSFTLSGAARISVRGGTF